MKKKLKLSRETIRVLRDAELAPLVGGDNGTVSAAECPTVFCPTDFSICDCTVPCVSQDR